MATIRCVFLARRSRFMLRRLLAVVLSLAGGEVAAQETSFLLINGTAYPISQLAVSESDFNFWTANVLRPPPIKGRAGTSRARAANLLKN